MSSLRQGVLRTVRLLPGVVKIGEKPKTALPSVQEGEQLSSEALSAEKTLEEKKNLDHDAQKLKELHETKVLNGKVAALEGRLSDAKALEQDLLGKIASLESEAAGVKNAFAQKERDLVASVDAAREKARSEGSAQGYSEGLENGRQTGLAQARTEIEGQYREKFSGLVSLFEGISTRLEEHFSELVALNQPRMLRLWQEMLKRMLQRETVLAPDAVLDVLSDILSRLSDKNNVLIYVSPEDLELLQASLQKEFEDVLRGVKHLELKPDTSVDKGSCIVETSLGVYDARWRTQLDQIETTLESLFQKLGKPPKPKETARVRDRKTGNEIDPELEAEAPFRRTIPKKTIATKKKMETAVHE